MKDPVSSLEKTGVWCFAHLSTKTCLLGYFSALTWKYLGMWWHVIFNIYTFLSTCKLCTICLSRCFLSAIYFNLCVTFLWLFLWHILKAIWKHMHWHLHISISSKVLSFPHKNFVEKIKHLHLTITTFVLNYLAPVSLTNFSILSFFHPSRGIHWCFIKKVVWIFRAPILTSISKKIVLVKILGNFPVKYSFWSPLFKYICRRPWRAKGHFHFRCAKESCLLSGL